MTTMTQAARPVPIDELMPKAIGMAEETGTIPSRDRLMKAFRIGFPKANEIYRRLQAESQKRRSRRARKIAQLGQKTPTRRVVEARVFDPAVIPVSPGMGPVDPWSYAVPVAVAEEAPTSTEDSLPDDSAGDLPKRATRPRSWPVLLLALPAFVAIWSGWVELGKMTGFGVVDLLPGFTKNGEPLLELNTAITLPIGVETYAAFALWVWLSGRVPATARRFAKWSALGSLGVGAAGQITYHLMEAAAVTTAPWQITTLVACLPVAVLGMGAALAHLMKAGES
jgi:hypothetical protein